jgi:hypothetical protein
MVSNGAICIKRKSHRVTPISDRCIGRIKYCYYARRLSSWPDAQHLYSFALHGDSTDNAKTVITIINSINVKPESFFAGDLFICILNF